MADMLSLLPDDQLDHFDSRYRLVLVAAQRAKQLMQGAKPPESSKYTKMTSIALEEALHGKVPYLKGQEARQALKEARRRAEHEFDRVMLAEADEDAKEIQQQLSVYIDDSPKEESAEGSEESEE